MSRPLFFAACLATMLLPVPAIAQTNPYSSSLRSREASNYTVLYVNPASGDDRYGDGGQYQPFATITHALQVAQPNTVILLAPGRYTAATGESFPLRLKPGVTLQGQATVTQSIVIQGGGTFTSASLGEQNAAVVAADGSGLALVVVANPAGHGLWVESGRPVIRNSAFVANSHTGLYVAGGAPEIEGSYFNRNGVAGLVLYGESRAAVRNNHFEATGTAITVAEAARPEISNNRIVDNEEGIVLLGNAQAAIAHNQIARNRRNGVVEVAMTPAPPAPLAPIAPTRPAPAVPADPTPTVEADFAPEPASPEAEPEAEDDIEAAPAAPAVPESVASPEAIAPELPELAESPVELPAVPAAAIAPPDPIPAPSAPAPAAAAPQVAIAPEPAIAPDSPAPADPVAPALPPTPPQIAVAPEPAAPPEPAAAPPERRRPSIAELRNRISPENQIVRPAEQAAIAAPVALPNSAAIDIAVIPAAPVASPPVPAPSENLPAARSPEAAPLPIALNAGNRLSVPTANIPLGSGGSASFSPPNGAGGPPSPPTRATALGLSYRVFVEPRTDADADRLRQLVPDAFRTRLNGQPLMQAGAYPDEASAQERLQYLLDNGINAWVEFTP